MSPELLNGSGYDWKNDVWSMGCIAYELCTLRSPFKDKTEKLSLYDLFNRINAGEYDQIHDKYSMKLRNLINSMLRVNPEERASLKEVVTVCESEHKKKKQKIDPYLIMDDIIEKLKLMNYEREFCKKLGKPPIS